MILLFFLLIIFFPLVSIASLDEMSIFTKDKTCAIHYLSHYPKYNWYIQVDSDACQNGWVNGFSKVQIYSSDKGKTEILEGFFNQGYWLDTVLPVGQIVERKSPSEGVQSLSFLLGRDTEANITYIGQMRAIQQKGRAYGPFEMCPDFRVLVIVPDVSLFKREAFLDKIVEQGLDYAHSYCTELNVLALFGAISETDPKIVFQMQVDPVTQKRQTFSVNPENKVSSENLLELRAEKADVLLSVTAEKEKTVVSYEQPVSQVVTAHPKLKKSSHKRMDILAHLRILSRAKNQPVWGRTVVHIRDILLDGTGVTDLPEEIYLVYYPRFQKGWAIVEGMLHDNKMQVSHLQLCEQEWCSDVP